MTPMTLEGQTIGKYHILEPLGRGGMAQVFRAYHPQLDRYVAIKVLRSDLIEEEEFLARFRREARAVAALRHHNIVQVFDFDVQDDLYYMVMELLEGDTLKAYLNSYRTRGEIAPISEVARIMTDVLDGLGYAHSEGIIHRDLKPANILLTKKSEAVITDFGIAQIVGGTNYTVSGALMGTLHYMAPEQGIGKNVDHRSDIYSLGIVLYEMLTGHPPFDADTPLAILLKHLNDPLPIPHKPDRLIPAPFERVVLKALEKKPEDRYQTAAELSAAIREAAATCEALAETRMSADFSLDNAPTVLPEAAGLPVQIEPVSPVMPLAEGTPVVEVSPAAEVLPATASGTDSDNPKVYSGTARQRIADRQFADDDTDLNLSKSLPPEALKIEPPATDLPLVEPPASFIGLSVVSAAQEPMLEEEDQEKFSPDKLSVAFTTFTSALGGVLSTTLTAAAEGISVSVPDLKPLVEDLIPSDQPDGELAKRKPLTAGKAALIGVGILVGVNLLGIYAGTAFNNWALFAYGWPAELLMAGVLLALLMSVIGEIWMLVPVLILVGNGFLFGFYSITGAWGMWSLCWPAEPLLVLAAIGMPMNLSKQPERGRRLARTFGKLLTISSVFGILAIGLGSVLASVFHLIIK